MACRVLVPQPGTEPQALGNESAESLPLNHRGISQQRQGWGDAVWAISKEFASPNSPTQCYLASCNCLMREKAINEMVSYNKDRITSCV